jgi:hypothetical protein
MSLVDGFFEEVLVLSSSVLLLVPAEEPTGEQNNMSSPQHASKRNAMQ